MATRGPKRILHTKIGVGTADGTVGNLRAVTSGGRTLLYISFNFHESLSSAVLCRIFNSIVFN